MHQKIFIGRVEKVIDNRNYSVVLNDETQILASLSSKVKLVLSNDIKENDEVAVELSPFDKTRGRITYKHSVMSKYFNDIKKRS